MINLAKFSQIREETVPIVNHWGQINGRKVFEPDLEDGWYRIRLGDDAEVIRSASPLEIERAMQGKKYYRVLALGQEGVPDNFDRFKRIKLNETVEVNFLSLQPFEMAKVVRWEDDRFYYFQTDQRFMREILRESKERFDNDQGIADLRGVTPELRYYFLVLELQRQSYRAYQEMERLRLSELEREKRLQEFRATFAGRLQETIDRAGGTLIKYVSQGRNFLVHWRIGDQVVKSTIHDDLRIISAGFCLSGDDRLHSMGSIVQLAKMFKESRPLYITRE